MSHSATPEPNLVADRVCSLLKTFNEAAKLGWVFPRGSSFRCFSADASRVELPDVAFTSFARMPSAFYTNEGHCETVPDLVVVVVSPEDRAYADFRKVSEWLTAGVRLVWELYPKTRTVYVTRPNGNGLRHQSGGTLTGEAILSGFACPVADLFRLPGEPATAHSPPI